MIDPGEELDLAKENIQPLKKGRVVSQLGTALLAQDDLQAHHELLKEREKYEVLLRSYEGSDPLGTWYEYILWVEQSFLRNGREGNLCKLLERCLTQFKEDERYLHDRRYIELWIKYIEMSINPLEVYKKCHAHGIGKYCAFFYMAWAFEFEKAGDIKRANQVFVEGFSNSSQPRDELEEAHKNFQLRVAKQVLSGESEVEAVCTEQRVALDKLKARGRKKNLVGSVRVGDHVQRGFAGVLRPLGQHGHNSGNVQAGSIQVFNEETDVIGTEFAVSEGCHLSSVPNRDILNKENSLDPGPWTGKPRKVRTAAVPVSLPQQPSFELHQDEGEQVQNCPVLICSALKPRKLDHEEFSCAIAVFEPEDPSKKPMYCKNKVYAGGIEFSFEELRAIQYLKGNTPRRFKRDGYLHNDVCDQGDELSCPVAIFESPNPTKRPMYCKSKVYAGGTEFSFEELREVEYLKGNRRTRCKRTTCVEGDETDNEPTVAKLYGDELHNIKIFEAVENNIKETNLQVAQATGQQHFNSYVDANIPAAASGLYVDVGREEDFGIGAMSPVLDAENAASACPELLGMQSNWVRNDDENDGIIGASSTASLKPTHMRSSPITDSSSDTAKVSSESCDQSWCHQSLTYNTKEAMKIIHGFWTTPENMMFQNTQCLHPEQPKVKVNPYEIYKDNREVQEQGNNYSSSAQQSERQVNNFSIFKDETEVTGLMQNGSCTPLDPAQHKSRNDWLCINNIQTSRNQRTENQIPELHEAAKENCPASYFREEDIPFIPSPGMTEEQENALKGTEVKENISPEGILPSEPEKRKLAGILQPSTDFPCDLQDDPALQQELPELETGYTIASGYTQAFSFPLLSSTTVAETCEQPHSSDTTEASVKRGSCLSNEVNTHRSVGSVAHTTEGLSIIMETTEFCKSSSSSSTCGVTTRHTDMLSQKGCTTGSMKESKSIDKINRNSEQERVITHKFQENPSFEEVHRLSQLYSNDEIRRSSESLSYKIKTMHHVGNSSSGSSYSAGKIHLPQWPGPSQNVCRMESTKSLLQEEQKGIHECQQVTERNSGFLKNCTRLGSKLQDDEILLKSEEDYLFQAKTGDPDHNIESESDCGDYKNRLLKSQENYKAIDFSKLQLTGHKDIDPFDVTLIRQLLTHVGFSKTEDSEQYVELNMQVPRFKIGGTITLGKDKFNIEKILGEGSYAKVFRATDMETQKTVALKVQKPSWEWEFYICRQLRSRLSNPLSAMAFMDIHMAYILSNGSIMVTEYSHYGSLLSIIIKLKQQWQPISENLMLYWMLELLSIAEKLQECRIIHGDIKPDNFILRTLPSVESREPSLQLIDMGRAIDMTLFPEGTTFNKVITTKDFQCIEMQTNQPWTYQTDLYGIAATMHCVYFNKYMKVHKRSDGRWFIQQSISRYSKRHVWEQFFFTLLNVESCEKLPDLSHLQSLVETQISSNMCSSDFAPVKLILGNKPKK